MSVHLYFSNNSIRHTTLSCDSLGIHYTVSHADSITSVTRWNSETDISVPVGEFQLPFFKKDRIRLGQDGEWRLARTFLVKNGGKRLSTWVLAVSSCLFCLVLLNERQTLTIGCSSRSFEANNGTRYKWKVRWGHLVVRLSLL